MSLEIQAIEIDINDLADFDPNDTELKEDESWEWLEGELFLLTQDIKGKAIKRRVKFKPKKNRCNAVTRVGYCHGFKVKGANRCKFHGAHLAKYQAKKKHENILQSGKYQDFLPAKIRELYQQVRLEGESADISPDIELLDGFLAFYLAQTEHGLDVSEVWTLLKGHLWDIKNYVNADEKALALGSIEKAESLLDPLTRAALAETKMDHYLSQKVKLIERKSMVDYRNSQTKMNYDAQLVMSLVYTLLQQFHDAMLNAQLEQETREGVLLDIAEYCDSEGFTGMLGTLIPND